MTSGRIVEKDMLTTPYVFGEADAIAMSKAGADIVVCHLGLTTAGPLVPEHPRSMNA